MIQNLESTVALLSRGPATYDALLRGMPSTWISQNEGEGTWDAIRILEHLIHCERTDWIPRIKTILQYGENRTFEPLDRDAGTQDDPDRSIDRLLDDFAHIRAANLSELAGLNLQPEDLDRRGNHPVFGIVTLSELLATWAVHDLTHLHQLSRILGHQYRDAVGPWNSYLGVLKCGGHSAP